MPNEYNGFKPTRTQCAGGRLFNEYNVEPGQVQVLGRNDIADGQSTNVDPEQCVVQVAEDGSCMYVWAQGRQPTARR